MNHQELAKDYFERHPLSDECHITSDERVFHTKGSAQSFANLLDDQNISSFERKLVMKEPSENKDASKHEKQNISPSEEEILEKRNFLQAADVEKLDYKELKSLVQFFGIKTDDQKAETLITALTEFKTTLNK